MCEKRQLVDLLESGLSDQKLDEKKPPITVRDWYTSRGDCGCEYKICVRLLGEDKETELDKWEHTENLEEGSDWKKVKHVFKDYPSGVRFVDFRHGGKDSKFWAGHFGVKMTKSAVLVGKKKKAKKDKKTTKSSSNLLTNPCAQSGMDGWEVIANGGDGFAVEEESAGAHPVTDHVEKAEAPSCWATSNADCTKQQTVDLEEKGYSGALLDEEKPVIKASDWFCPRGDAGCVYWLNVWLLDGDGQELDKKEVQEQREKGSDWTKAEVTFTDYPAGVRKIRFSHGAKDDCFWAGHYGGKMTHSSLVIETKASKSSSSSSSSSSSDDE